MKRKQEKIVSAVEGWIVAEELPAGAGLNVIRPNDPHAGLSRDEIEEWAEFIAWYLRQDMAVLLLIPAPAGSDDFYLADHQVTETEYSAFCTHDFQRLMRPFNKADYAYKKLLERVRDLGLLYSVLSDEEGRRNTRDRFRTLLERELSERLGRLLLALQRTSDREKKDALIKRIGRIQRQVRECEAVWERYSQTD